jgi:hypothetical protein
MSIISDISLKRWNWPPCPYLNSMATYLNSFSIQKWAVTNGTKFDRVEHNALLHSGYESGTFGLGLKELFWAF